MKETKWNEKMERIDIIENESQLLNYYLILDGVNKGKYLLTNDTVVEFKIEYFDSIDDVYKRADSILGDE